MRKVLTLLAVFLVVAGFSTTSMAIKHDRDLRDKVEDLVHFEYNEELFTLSAFLNYTGMDSENFEFTDIRQNVREDLEDMNINISDDRYFENHDTPDRDYYRILTHMGKAPNFKIDMKEVPNFLKSNRDLNKLNVALAEFYREADISSLYKKYEEDYDEIMSEAENETYDIFTRVIDTLNIDIDKVSDVTIYIEPMYSRESGINYETEDMIYEFAGLDNASNVNYPNLVHEFLHSIINPIVDDNSKATKKVYRRIGVKRQDNGFMYECFVRPMTYTMFDDVNEGMEWLQSGGSKNFKICDDIMKRFSEVYVPDEFTLEKFISDTLESIDDEIDEDDDIELVNVLDRDYAKDYAKDDDEYIKIAKDQIIVIDYNDILRRKTVDDDNIKMYNEDGDEMDITPFYNYDSILILQNENYEEGEVYILEIEDIEDKDRDDIRDKILKFEIIED